MAEGHGGSRPGAGRKPKREQYGRVYKATEKELHSLLPKVAPALEDLIVGVLVQEDTEDGPRVYKSPPNVRAIELLLNRTIGAVQKPEDGPRDGNVFIFQIAPPPNVTVIDSTAREVPQLG